MIESVVALLMFLRWRNKGSSVFKNTMASCLRGKSDKQKFIKDSESVSYKCFTGIKQNLNYYTLMEVKVLN